MVKSLKNGDAFKLGIMMKLARQ